MTQPSLFNGREEVIDFLLTQIRELSPNAHYEPIKDTDNHEFNIWFTGIKEATHVNTKLELYDILNTYEKSSDINVLIDFINTQGALFGQVSNLSEARVKLDATDALLPIVRPADFSPYASKDLKEVSDTVGKGVKIMYAYDSPKGLDFIHTGSIPPGFTHDTLTDKAFENLKAKGWMPHMHKQEGPGADLYIFEDRSGRPFQAQFLVSEWTKQHLGEEFYFTFPTMETAFIMVPNKTGGILSMLAGAGPQQALKSLANQVYQMNEKAFSPLTYSFKKGRIDLI